MIRNGKKLLLGSYLSICVMAVKACRPSSTLATIEYCSCASLNALPTAELRRLRAFQSNALVSRPLLNIWELTAFPCLKPKVPPARQSQKHYRTADDEKKLKPNPASTPVSKFPNCRCSKIQNTTAEECLHG